MTNNSVARFITAAGLLVLGAATASAASRMQADVPFDFSTPAGGSLPAGKIMVQDAGSFSAIPMYRITHVDTGKSVLVSTALTLSRPRNSTAADSRIVFECAGETCALQSLYPAGSQVGHGVPVNLKPSTPATQIAEISIPLGE